MTTAVLSMVAQMASVELILVWLPNGVVKVDALAWAVAMLVAKDRPGGSNFCLAVKLDVRRLRLTLHKSTTHDG